MPYTGNGPVERPTVLGLAAAAVWLVGLVPGVSALAAGHPVVAAVSVVLALVAPWLGWRGICTPGPTMSNCPSLAAGSHSPLADLRSAGPVSLIVSCAISLFPRVWIAPRWGTA
jgi:hypothetical protein